MLYLIKKKPHKHFPKKRGNFFFSGCNTYEWYASIIDGRYHTYKMCRIDIQKCIDLGYLVECPKNLSPDDLLEWMERKMGNDIVEKISKNYKI